MIRMFVRHNVKDYAAWRKHYDAFNTERAGMGVKGHAVYCEAANANDVTVTHDFDSLEAAKAFASSARLKEVMTAAGVAGTPSIWMTTPKS